MNCRQGKRIAMLKAARILEAAINTPEFYEGDGIETETDCDCIAGYLQDLVDRLWRQAGGRGVDPDGMLARLKPQPKAST